MGLVILIAVLKKKKLKLENNPNLIPSFYVLPSYIKFGCQIAIFLTLSLNHFSRFNTAHLQNPKVDPHIIWNYILGCFNNNMTILLLK